MTSDHLAAERELNLTGKAFMSAIESLFMSNGVDKELLELAYRQAMQALVLAERALSE